MEKEKSKYIYESVVNKSVEEKVTEKRKENGEEIEITKTVKKLKPTKIAVLKPDRRRYKEAEIYYAKRLSAYLKDGLLPHSLVSKRYLNDGGPLSDEEKEFVGHLRESYVNLQEEYFAMKTPLTEEQTKRRGELILELNQINKTLQDIQNNYSEIFSNTAEAKSKGDVMEWWILNLSYVDLDDKGYKPFYGEGDFDTRMKVLEDLEAQEDDFTNELIKKLSYFVSFWHTAGNEAKPEDYKSADENYAKNVTEYLLEEEKTEEADKVTKAAEQALSEAAAKAVEAAKPVPALQVTQDTEAPREPAPAVA